MNTETWVSSISTTQPSKSRNRRNTPAKSPSGQRQITPPLIIHKVFSQIQKKSITFAIEKTPLTV